MKRNIKRLRKKRRVWVDFETEGLAVGRLLYIQKPNSPHTTPLYTKLLHAIETTPLPASYRFNTEYDALSICIEGMKALAVKRNLAIITAIQQKRPKTVNLFATFDLRNIRL